MNCKQFFESLISILNFLIAELLTTRVTIHGGIGTFNHAIFKLEYHIEGIHPAVDEFFIE